MGKSKRRTKFGESSSICKKQATAYIVQIEEVGRASFLDDGLNLINQRVRPYQ